MAKYAISLTASSTLAKGLGALCTVAVLAGGAASASAATAAAAAAAAAAYYVSASGHDTAVGNAAHPFRTLARAVHAMESSSTKTTYVQGGTYSLSSTLTMTSADSGITIAAVTGAKAILTGNNSLQTLIQLNGATGVTLQGLEFTNAKGQALIMDGGGSHLIMGNLFANNGEGMLLRNRTSKNVISGNEIDNSSTSGIELQNQSNSNKIVNNVIDKTTTIGTSGTTGGGVYGHGTSNNLIANNLVENTAGVGIGISNWDSSTISTYNTILNNVVKNTNTSSQATDSGAIYMLGRSNVNTHSVISGNFISGPTTAAAGSGAHIVGIYLDDNTSGVTVTYNIIANVITHGLQIHGGNNTTVQNNIFDLGAGTGSAILFQYRASDVGGSSMKNNVATQNIITSTSSSPVAYSNISGGTPSITKNFYMDPTNSNFKTNGLSQTGAKYGNAKFASQSTGNYSLGTSSAALAIGFVTINESVMGPHPVNAHWFGTLSSMTTK
jgi:hypothetical protein